MLATAAAAQTVPDEEVPSAGLDLPANLQIFGKADPNVRKPTAIVNNTVITGTDVDQRLALVLAINDLNPPAAERDQIRLQVLRSLIDETLQIQEAAAAKITVDKAEVDQTFARVAQRRQLTPDQFRQWIRSVGSSERSIRRQIEGELAWSRLLRRRVSIDISDAEVESILKRIEAAKGTHEYRVFEIYMSATPERAEEVYRQQQALLQQMREGTPFDSLAHIWSEATTKIKGGDLGWIRTVTLPEQLATPLQTMQVGQVAGPIEVPGGFSIIYLADTRQVLVADPRDARLNLRQITLTFAPGTTEEAATTKAAELAKQTASMQGCGDVPRIAQALGADVVNRDSIRVRDLPGQVANLVVDLQVGQATQPFGSLESGVRVLVLCGRDDPVAELPSKQDVSQSLEDERTGRRAERMLRDLRRDAIVEYR
ncbi:peptidylprolyl isomerase [Sphingomonas canadensis]|uniref:Parvulin-like PPIase n=1 Tax=Sphingomonas canadensis TaxID=1219257 RepID=A0ABW3HAC5_9SPHN|nr:peptidylprolyl isomerase [Sphingomonas canadensis]MCW3836748.1 peptidylprolyl isomerase [Sphingomonas canadensis]